MTDVRIISWRIFTSRRAAEVVLTEGVVECQAVSSSAALFGEFFSSFFIILCENSGIQVICRNFSLS